MRCRRSSIAWLKMTRAGIPFYTVDAFTAKPFAGNPAAVCLDADDLSDGARQAIAREMNLSETAFVYGPGPGGRRRLRWFTPVAEVPLCGHATLASAHVLLREAGVPGPVEFQSASGPLSVREDADAARPRRLVMDLPANPPQEASMLEGLAEALGLTTALASAGAAGSRRDGSAAFRESAPAFAASDKVAVVALPSERAVLAVEPDFGALKRVVLPGAAMGVAVTAPGDDGVDFVSRFFAPWLGVDEDPVTGVAHTTLAPYWAAALGKTELEARQRSARGGALVARSLGDRVELAGHAVTVATGTIVRP